MQTKDQVRSERGSLSIPIDISWVVNDCRTARKKATAIAITHYGALIVFRQELEPAHQVSIHCAGTDREASALVLGQVRLQKDGYVYGLSLLDTSVNPWDVDIPRVEESKRAVSRHLLECDACQARESVYLDEIQIEVFDATRSVALRCKQCSAWTMWKLADHEVASHPSQRSGGADASSDSDSPAVPRTANERKHFRVRLKRFKACIRRLGFLEDVVRVENVSRGGFRFSSLKTYRKGTRIEVAIPYAPEGANIFVSARVVRSRDLPRMKKKEYGAAYVKRDEIFLESLES